jgi:hypothetical protein
MYRVISGQEKSEKEKKGLDSALGWSIIRKNERGTYERNL